MLASAVPWILAALACLAAALLLARLRATTARLHQAEQQATSLGEKLKAATKRSGARSAGDRRRGDELGELRRKLEKARKRATQAREEQLAESHRIKELEEKLRLRDSDVRAVRRSEAAVKPAASPPPPAARPAPAPSPAPPIAAPRPKPPEVVESEALQAAGRRVEQAEAKRQAAEAALAELQVQVKRLHGKVKTQDKLYSSIRLELEAKKDRLGAQQEELERLRALRVALLDAPGEAPQSLAADPSTQELSE